MPSKNKIALPKGTLIPNHLAIIPDGNRRWARARGLHTLEGHKAGFKRAVQLGRAARALGIHTVTLWGFSTENWDRTEAEIGYLMKLYERLVDEYLKEARKEGVRIVHLGRKDRLPKPLLKKITKAESETLNNTKHVMNIAIDYGGHDDIIRATKKMIADGVRAEEVDKKMFEKYLDTHDQPYPYVDLLIRTSGEQRTSGLLLWQMDYAEMYWETDHLPDFTPEKLREAILDYSRRRRRYGGNDDVNHLKFKPQLAAKFEVAWWRLAKIPEGTKFSEYTLKHIKEQFGLSSQLATQAGKFMLEALREGKKSKWRRATIELKKFYKLIRDEVKLAFEPSIVASMEVKLWQKEKDGLTSSEVEDLARDLLAETYRISEFQAAKAAHLRVLATRERALAESGGGEAHWNQAQDYLEKYYTALKDRVA